MSVTIRARLPKGDTNGLTHLAEALRDREPRIVVGILKATGAEESYEKADDPRVVKTALVHVEVLDGAERERAEKALRRVYESRTGKRELPFEQEAQPSTEEA